MNEEKSMKKSGLLGLLYTALMFIVVVLPYGTSSLIGVFAIILFCFMGIKYLLEYIRQLSDYNSKLK